jgi:cation diffusion facilitator CzcD-associated flavoprotein CzcO
MRKKLVDRPWVADVIVPTDFAVGCRRPTPGNGYLEALCDERVTVVPAGISSIDATGVVDANGVHHEVDIIICATGFDVSWRPRYPLIGRDGVDLRDEWANGPDNYLSITVPKFPNYYSESSPCPSLHTYDLSLTFPSASSSAAIMGRWLIAFSIRRPNACH